MHIVIIDDEKILWKSLETKLKKNDFSVTLMTSYSDFLEQVHVQKADLYLVDISLGDGSGFDVIKKLKEDINTQEVPVIFISGHSDTKTIVQGLDLGWDDYIVKPFESDELLARIRRCLRKDNIDISSSTVVFWNISFDASQRKAYLGEQEISLSRKEKQILEFFLLNPEKCISKQDLDNKFWWPESSLSVTENTINVTMCNLRRKLWPSFHLETIVWEWYCLYKK